MKILSKDFVKKWPKMILNIHPSILPNFKGLNAQKQAIENNAKYSGCTVHYVNEVMDGGEIIDQKLLIFRFTMMKILYQKILMEEHKLYIKVLKNWRIIMEKVNSKQHESFYNKFIKFSIISSVIITILLALLWFFLIY